MKRFFSISLFFAAAAIAVSCQNKELAAEKSGPTVKFTINASLESSKTYIEEDLISGGYNPFWKANDEIGVVLNSLTPSKSTLDFTLENYENDGAKATFCGEASQSGIQKLYAFYPASSFAKTYDGGTLGLNLNTVQYPTCSSFDPACDLLVAMPYDITVPSNNEVMIDDMRFTRRLAILRVNLIGSDLEGDIVSSIKLSNTAKTLTGRPVYSYDANTGIANISSWTVNTKEVEAQYNVAGKNEGEYVIVNDDTINSVYFVVNPTTIDEGTELTFELSTNNHQSVKRVITAPSDMELTAGAVSVINLKLRTKDIVDTSDETFTLISSADDLVDGEYIICMALTGSTNTRQYLDNTPKTKPGTIAFSSGISISQDLNTITLSSTVTNAKWLLSTVTGGKAITSCANDKVGLGTTSANDGLSSQTTYYQRPWTITTDATYNWKLKFNDTNRYLCVYTLANPRTYTSNTTNANGKFYLYRAPLKEQLNTPSNLFVTEKTLSWSAVENAASYAVSIGDSIAVVSTTEYVYCGKDDYYNVSVIAMPSDKKTYRNSQAATLTDQVFGTPTLDTPVLESGSVLETSISVNWTADSRATNGYLCQLYDNTTLVDEGNASGSVSFNDLTPNHQYTVKVQALAVDGAKAYAASGLSTIDISTKAPSHISDVNNTTTTYTIFNLKVYATPNAYTAIIGDGTGFLSMYINDGHEMAIGTTFNLIGKASIVNGTYQFKNPTISNVSETPEVVTYPDAIEATEEYLSAYESNSSVVYVSIHGSQSGRNVTVGSKVVYLNPASQDTDEMDIEAYGFLYGYNSNYNNSSFATVSIHEDTSLPKLSIDPSAKTWNFDETDSFVVSVESVNGGWDITPTTLDWATVVTDKVNNTITVTPNGTNSSSDDYTATITVSHSVATSLTKTISLKQKKQSEEKTYTFTITKSDFSTASYSANDGSHESTATASDKSTMKVSWVSSSIMQNNSSMQWKKSAGSIYNSTNLGTLVSVTVNSTSGSYTTYYGSSQNPSSSTQLGGSFFKVKVGSATGYTTSIVVVFKL